MLTTLLNSLLFYVIVIVIPIIYWYLSRNYNYWSKRGIKGPKPVIVFGNILSQMITPLPKLLVDWQTKYGQIYGIYTGSRPILVLSEPELIKTICVKDFQVFTDRRKNERQHPILSSHLIAESGDNWKRIRAIVTPTFTSGKMKKMFPMINECLTEFLNVLDTYAMDGKDINVKTMFGNYTMDVIATCAFATKTNSHNDSNSPFILNARKIISPKMSRLLSMVLLPKSVNRMLNIKHPAQESANQFFFNITRHIINERKSNKKSNNYNDFIQLLLNAKKSGKKSSTDVTTDENDTNESHHLNEGEEEMAIEKKALSGVERYITDDEILAQCWVFFNAGYETTGTALTFASYELALNPDIQEKLYEEVMSALNSKGELDYDLLSSLQYLDAIISETLRLHSPVLLTVRYAYEDYSLGDTGITVQKGHQIQIPIYSIHHSEKYYENPLKFSPERFLPENRHKIIPYTYLPFGAGPRNCVGMRFALMETKLALVQIVQRFRFIRSPQTEVPLSLNKTLFLHSPKKVIVGIERRTLCSVHKN